MKKRINLFLGVLVLFLFPFLVFADMGSPEITSYEVRVISVSGTNLVDWEGKTITSIPYDTLLKITMEEEREGILYGGTEVNKKWGYVKLSDTKVIQKELDLSQFTKANTPQERYVFTEGAFLYNGPSTIYGKVEGEVMIPKGTKITFEYSDDCWAYVEYNGTKGWVYTYTYKDFGPYDISSSLAYLATGKANKVMTLEEVELVNNPVEEKKTGIKIPANQEITYDYYYYARPKETYYHVTYGDEEGWIETSTKENGKDIISARSICLTLMVTTETLPLYKSYFDEASISKVSIPFGTELEVIYAAYGFGGESAWYYVSYEGRKGWVKDNSDEEQKEHAISLNYGMISNYLVTNDSLIYKDFQNKEDAITLKKDSKVSVLYSYTDKTSVTWLYVREESYEGWIQENDNMKYEGYEEVCIDVVSKGEIDPVEEKEKQDREEQEEASSKKEKKNKSLSSNMILLLSIGGAIALAIASGVTIVLVHKAKKKKQNKEETL